MRRATRKAVSLALAGVLALAAAAGCSEKTGPSSASQGESIPPQSQAQPQAVTGKITVYTSEPQDLVTDMLEDFVGKNPGITYELFRSGTGAVISKIPGTISTIRTRRPGRLHFVTVTRMAVGLWTVNPSNHISVSRFPVTDRVK